MKKHFSIILGLGLLLVAVCLNYFLPSLETGAATAGLFGVGIVKANRSSDILDMQLGGGFQAWDGTENAVSEALEIHQDDDSNFEFAINRLRNQGRLAEAQSLRNIQKQAIAGRQLAYKVSETAHRGTQGKPIASITAVVKRVSANISESLPFVLFGRNSANTFYDDVIKSPVLPAGVTLSNVTIGETFANRGKVIFEYTQGAAVDTVEVFLKSNTLTYTQLLSYLYTNMFEINKMKLKLSSIAGNALTQQDNPYSIFKSTMFGKSEGNETIPTDWKLAQQNENGILDVDMTAKFDQQTGLLGSIIDIVGFQVTHTLMVSAYVANQSR